MIQEHIVEKRKSNTATGEQTERRAAVLAGGSISGLVVTIMLIDGMTKIIEVPAVVKESAKLGFGAGSIQVIGIILLACTVIYMIPRTSIIGAVLLTGYFGGAVSSNLRVGAPLLGYVLGPVYFGILVWAGLYLRNRRVREFFSVRKTN